MAVFNRETLESYKYADLVKVAKEHDVYRRYAPKAELIEKLLAKSEPVVETLNDVSMPSFMENDESAESDGLDEIEAESALLQVQQNSKDGIVSLDDHVKGNCVPEVSSPRVPLIDKNKTSTPQIMRKSLAGPAKPTVNSRRAKRQVSSEAEDKTEKENEKSQTSTRRATRQRTFDVDRPDNGTGNKKQHSKREGTFDVENEEKGKNSNLKREGTFDVVYKTDLKGSCRKVKETTSLPHKVRREGTFEVKEIMSAEPTDNTCVRGLRREGTFEVEENTPSDSSRSRRLRREGTFEVGNTSVSKTDVPIVKPKSTLLPTPRTSSKRLSEMKQSARVSLRSPYQFNRTSVATPSSVKPSDKTVNAQSIPRRFITSRNRQIDLASPAAKSKIPSVVSEIGNKKAEVSAKKVAAAMSDKPVLGKKAPDFSAIHKRLFGKMESLVDSKQKVVDRAKSIQKNRLAGQRSPPNTKVVRKLLSPKVGKSKLVSPKPVFQHIASAYASNVVSIQKRPSIGSSIQGVSKLQSPALKIASKVKAVTGPSNSFGFTKAEPSRKDALKASVMGRKPLKRNSPMAKAKQALQTVRLNKRFELQMKHRLAQQTSN